MKTETDEYTLTYDDSTEAKDRAFEILRKWFLKTQHFTGESIQQFDDTYVDAPEVLTRIAEQEADAEARRQREGAL